MKWSVSCFFLAGVCGAVVGSSIPDFESYDEYDRNSIGFWGIGIFKPKVWISLEHLMFWLGITPVVFTFVLCGSGAFGTSS